MGLIIKTREHIFRRVLIIVGAIGLFAISPVLISVIGAWFIEIVTNEPCHEGNCAWGAIGWYAMLTIPIALVLLIVFMVVLAIDLVKLKKQTS